MPRSLPGVPYRSGLACRCRRPRGLSARCYNRWSAADCRYVYDRQRADGILSVMWRRELRR